MKPDCNQIAAATTLRLELVENHRGAVVEAEFVNNFNAPLWLAQEPTPAYRVDKISGAVLISYGYFEDVYGSFRGRYMIPPMRKVAPSETVRWRIEDRALLEKMMAPGVPVQLRIRAAVAEFPTSNVRGRQPLDDYLERSCPLQAPSTVLRPPKAPTP